MLRQTRTDLVRALLDRHGPTYAERAGIRLADAPSPLYRVLLLSVLRSARINAVVAVAAAQGPGLVDACDLPRLPAALVRRTLDEGAVDELTSAR